MVWLYTPLALPIAHALHPDFLVYDVMDDLASFRGASPHLRVAQTAALDIADIVFTGGRSLYAGVVGRRSEHTHLFPSGVEPEHFASAKGMRTPHERPVAGYVGVIDERLDLELIAEVADELPDWDVHIVGPIAKIEREELPGRPNLSFPGPVDYRHLPKALAEFDVALMPFALNDATRSISPTKTLEYMAAGLPIVSTKVPDVVADFSDVVLLADDVVDFAHHCRAALREAGTDAWEQRIAPIVERHRWDCIAGNMSDLIDARREELERSELSLPGGHGDGLRRSA
jgi:glycosyltransferase involved in cell wall biosynthesis